MKQVWVTLSSPKRQWMLLGLSAWFVWADGGFHRHPSALALYVAVLSLGPHRVRPGSYQARSSGGSGPGRDPVRMLQKIQGS
ncbi:hypothetical protein SAY86_020354 [Trapa natans]|uniref:Uncharacterized protein n=1 Tax=Trapa natans TaxID=22666 RepID=A0AAN7R5H4_TRANT|nr:hypothetical protein SAY86_020354 [Trapa natans]